MYYPKRHPHDSTDPAVAFKFPLGQRRKLRVLELCRGGTEGRIIEVGDIDETAGTVFWGRAIRPAIKSQYQDDGFGNAVLRPPHGSCSVICDHNDSWPCHPTTRQGWEYLHKLEEQIRLYDDLQLTKRQSLKFPKNVLTDVLSSCSRKDLLES